MLKKLRALVTAGATVEPIDPVRFISNRSSGKQGISIANTLHDRGFEVTLVLGNCSDLLLSTIKEDIRVKRVETALEMLNTCEAIIKEDNSIFDLGVFTAAVSDFRPKYCFDKKLKKGSNDKELESIELVRNPDILKEISNSKFRPNLMVGFAAETDNLIQNAERKIKSKGCDLIVANDVSKGKVFAKDNNEVFLVARDNKEKYDNFQGTKEEVADFIVSYIISEMN